LDWRNCAAFPGKFAGIIGGVAPQPKEFFVKQATSILRISTGGRGLIEVTREVRGWLKGQSVSTGLVTIFCAHTSASLLIQENAAPEVRSDLEAFFERIAPENPGLYAHDDEGPDDMPAHLRAALTQVQLSIPVIDGQLALGTWQGIYLFEHRRRPHERRIALHLLGQ
jgi:secondary thiamine-phosphate synthase enzyme